MEETVRFVKSEKPEATNGTGKLADHYPGMPATVSAVAATGGGLAPGAFIEPDIDEELFQFNSEDTPLMNLMLRAKKVAVDSPEVEHYMIDEAVTTLRTVENSESGTYVALPLDSTQQAIPRPYTTLLVKGIDGYEPNGTTVTPGRSLMLFVTGRNDMGRPIVRACNGLRSQANSGFCTVPMIPAGTEIVVLSNALYETQKEIDPDLIVPQPSLIYLQKRGMNQVVSDYFDHQRKRLPFSKAIIAEQAISSFKTRGNRTLWASRASKFEVETPKVGVQTVYTTEGLRWQFKREIAVPEDMTIENINAIAKMFFTGEDVPKTALLLAGKNLLERIQRVDFSKHPEMSLTIKENSMGWTVTNFHTVFGDIEIKREPTLDALGWSNSGALIGENRLVHYVYRSESSFNDKVEGEEATRSGLIVWDGVALKGNCHIWLNGEGEAEGGECGMILYDGTEELEDPRDGTTLILTADCPEINPDAKSGQVWVYRNSEWVRA